MWKVTRKVSQSDSGVWLGDREQDAAWTGFGAGEIWNSLRSQNFEFSCKKDKAKSKHIALG